MEEISGGEMKKKEKKLLQRITMKHTNEMVPMIAIQNIQKPLATNLIVEKGKCEIKRNIHKMFLFILSTFY
jgi:hypothetical protein